MGHSSNEELRQNLSGELCVCVQGGHGVYYECRLADEVCVCVEVVYTLARLAQAHTNLGVTMDSKGAFEVF